MAKKHTLPVGNGSTGSLKAVKQAGQPVIGVSNAIDGPDRISIQERKYRAEDGARTLARAQEIKKDKVLMKDIKSHIKMMNKACE